MPLELDFSDKLVLITGGGRGIGLGIAKALAKGGADIAITFTSQDASKVAEELSQQHGVKVQAFKCEVTRSSEIDSMIQEVEKAYGKKIDIAIANAGVSMWKDATENTDDDYRQIMSVNLDHPFFLSRALVRSWLDLPVGLGGSESRDVGSLKDVHLGKQIFFVSSISGIVAMNPQKQTAYNASKGGLTMMAKSLAAEWAHIGVSVNCVSPGYITTDMITKSEDPTSKAYAAEWSRRTPVGRFASPEELGEFIAVMVSSKAGGGGFMTGTDVIFDGGYTLY